MFDPERNRHSPDAATLAPEVSDDPPVLPHLDVLCGERGQFPSPQRAADQESEDGVVPLALDRRAIGNSKQFPCLLLREPVAKPGSLLPDIRDVRQARGFLGGQQTVALRRHDHLACRLSR